MGEESESRGERVEWKRPVGLVPKGIRSNKGPQNEWLFKIGRAETDECRWTSDDGHTRRGRGPELDRWRPRRAEWKEWREALGGWATRKKKGTEQEVDLLGIFFLSYIRISWLFFDASSSGCCLLFLFLLRSLISLAPS